MPTKTIHSPRGGSLRRDLPNKIGSDNASDGFVVAIDGPAGAGKSTASRLLAERLGFHFLDTGAMYRSVTLAVLRSNCDPMDWPAVAQLAQGLQIELDPNSVRLNGEDVTQHIRAPEVSAAIGKIADNPEVRDHLSGLQRRWAQGKQVVTEGRDQGSVVFRDSLCKIFLTASDQERARRRCEELNEKGIAASYDDVLKLQLQRDGEDYARALGGLKIAEDAEVVMTDGLTLDEVVDQLVAIVNCRLQETANATRPHGNVRAASDAPIEQLP